MRRINNFIKAVFTVSLLYVAFFLTGCVRPTPPAQETTSSPHEQMKPQVLPVTQSPDAEMRAEPAKMRSAETVVTSENQTITVEEKEAGQPVGEPPSLEQIKNGPAKEVALNTKRQAEKKSATRVATPPIAKIEISPRSHSLNPCEQKKFSASVKDNGGRQIKEAKVTWESTDPKIAAINKSGVVTGVSPGFTFIRAVNGKIKSESSTLFVRDKQADRKC
jgi:hypothetical protein